MTGPNDLPNDPRDDVPNDVPNDVVPHEVPNDVPPVAVPIAAPVHATNSVPSSPAGPPVSPPISTMSSIGLGCGGFVGFFALVLLAVPTASSLGPYPTAIVGVALLVLAVYRARSASPHGRAQVVRVAIGFGVGAILFGGCFAMLSNMSFH